MKRGSSPAYSVGNLSDLKTNILLLKAGDLSGQHWCLQ